MSQSTFDPTAPAQPTDGGQRDAKTQGAQATSSTAPQTAQPEKVRRRPARRGRGTPAAAPQAEKTEKTETAPAPQVAAPATPVTPVTLAEAAAAVATPTEEAATRPEGHGRRGARGGARRTSARTKTGAQLVKPARPAEEHAGEHLATRETETATPATEGLPDLFAAPPRISDQLPDLFGDQPAWRPTETEPGTESATPAQPASESPVEATATAPATASVPVIVPVVETEAAQPAAQAEQPRKLRFGQPRRFRTPAAAAPAAETPQAAATVTPTPTPSGEAETEVQVVPVTASEEPEAAAAPEAPEAPEAGESAAPRRYRFQRPRPTMAGATAVRQERLSGDRAGVYTAVPATPEAKPEAPTTEAEFALQLPPIETLGAGGRGAAELPALAFDNEQETLNAAPATPAPAARAARAPRAASALPRVTRRAAPIEERAPERPEIGEEAGEPEEAPDHEAHGAGDGGGRRRRRRRRRGENEEQGFGEENQPEEETHEPLFSASLPGYEEEYAPAQPELPAESPAQRGRNGRYGYSARPPVRPAAPELEWEAPMPPAQDLSPYASPEPAYARGFGPTPRGVAAPLREAYPRPTRPERGDTTAAGLAAVSQTIREAISGQTDRLLSELRRQQQPPAVSLTLPSTERVGVFVDVANIVYSARSLRTAVDFGRMLDFLRANRRLARAQAYAPTNPEPGAEQMFLGAVKGLGYRITTKNYKTFANGAKKADMDLDLCMDIVRLVDAKALDTVVLVSGDSDFLPLLDYCADHGVRVEVAAFDDAASMVLRQSCDLFINLSMVDEIRA